MPLMSRGYRKGTIKFGLITAVKDAAAASAAAASQSAQQPAPAATAPPSEAAPPSAPKRSLNPIKRLQMRPDKSSPPPQGFDWGGTY